MRPAPRYSKTRPEDSSSSSPAPAFAPSPLIPATSGPPPEWSGAVEADAWMLPRSLLEIHGNRYLVEADRLVFDLAAVKKKSSLFRRGPRAKDWTKKSSWKKNSRGKGLYLFTARAADYFLARNDVLCILRGHQQKPGFDVAAESKYYNFPRLITVFSAPNYTDANLAVGGLADFGADGKLVLRAYSWNHHPVYKGGIHVTKTFEKHYVMEDYVQYLNAHASHVLRSVSLLHIQSKGEVRNFLAAMRQRGRKLIMGDLEQSSTDWEFLANNLADALNAASDKRVHTLLYAERIRKRDNALWLEGFDYFANSLLREAVNELEELTLDTEPEPIVTAAAAQYEGEAESASDTVSLH